jgi:2-polyprenyl-3-methyl-5-hydroxy-6-metoxy-1,4-benzoquinol methylase
VNSSLPENSYGRRKRFEFVAWEISSAAPRRVLDVGCGNGSQLTAPLAEAFPGIRFTAVDQDSASIAAARARFRFDNLTFAHPDEVSKTETYDLVLAAEVLEHVEEPYAFLLDLRARMSANGRLVVTVPNGYGPFEMMAMLEALLSLSGVQNMLRRVKRALMPPESQISDAATLAISPHVNFFSRKDLRRLFADAGLHVARFSPTTLFCGYLLDHLVRGRALVSWNACAADRLPPMFSSDWMFALHTVSRPCGSRWRRSGWARARRRLSLRRWGCL